MSTWFLGGHPVGAAELLALFGHFLLLSLLAVGGAMATAPDMHRFVVDSKGWLSDLQFTTSVALAQAAPGPNVLFVAVIGWNIAGPAGVLATMLGNLLPSTLLALSADRWGERNRQSRFLRAFKAGMAPLTVGLLLSTGWVLAEPISAEGPAMAFVAGTALLMWRSKLGPLWPIGVGAILGALGWV